MKVDLDKLNELKERKLVGVQKHPDADLLIWNYTHKAQYEGEWTPELRMARGLITDLDGNILYRPFSKFFNYQEHTGEDSKLEPLPDEPFDVFVKFDGSLGILYWIGNDPFIATRGSFVSDQAVKGTEMLRKYDTSLLSRDHTYLFEIIYPENRIVVDYGDKYDLVLLAVLDTETGKDCDDLMARSPFGYATKHIQVPVKTLKDKPVENEEGYVLRFKSGVRTKVKFDEYVRLHRLVTGVNAKTIWDLLRHNESMDELMERVPDEFLQWVVDTKANLEKAYADIEKSAKEKYEGVSKLPTRKDQAISMSGFPYNGIVFRMLDEKTYSDLIWKMLKPKAEAPFKEDIDA